MAVMGEWEQGASDSPIGWVRKHTEKYVESGGAQGHRWSGLDTLLLTTRGRRSGQLRRTALIYGRDGESFVVVGSNGGKPKNPDWYLNLLNDATVHIQVGPDKFVAQASTVHGTTRQRLWAQMAAIFPQYDKYSKKADREIPVVLITPLPEGTGL